MRIAYIAVALAFCACSTVRLQNGCVVDALSHQYAVSSQQQLSGKTDFNEVLVVEFTDRKTGHALSIFAHKGDLWAYDYSTGSWKISRGISTDAVKVAGFIYPRWRIKGAEWL